MAGIAAPGQAAGGHDVHGDQVGDHLRVDVAEFAVARESGVVDQQVRRRRGDHPLQLGQAAGIGEVSGMSLHPHVVLAG
jgi:hypothetical protein